MLKISLEAARRNAGFTQKQAAAALGISNKTLCQWEKGVSIPRIDKIEAICALYHVAYDNIDFLRNK
jgi:transcriptional regulator with XRE-family HTH domain